MARLRNSSSVAVELSRIYEFHVMAGRDPSRKAELREFHKAQARIIREKLETKKRLTKRDLTQATDWKKFCEAIANAIRAELGLPI